jgi:hypothetical protein
MFSWRFGTAVAVAAATAALVFPATPLAKSVGGCPSGDGWQLVTVESLGIPPEDASGIPSLDGNLDGRTCIKPLTGVPGAPEGAFIFRDNTVQG